MWGGGREGARRDAGGVLQVGDAGAGCCSYCGCWSPGLGAAAAVAAGRRGWVLRLLLLLDAGVRCCGCWGCWTPGRGLLDGGSRETRGCPKKPFKTELLRCMLENLVGETKAEGRNMTFGG